MHVHLCLPSDKDLSVCIHTPMWRVCVYVHAHTYAIYGRCYMHGTALKTQYVQEEPLRLLNNALKANESNSIYIRTNLVHDLLQDIIGESLLCHVIDRVWVDDLVPQGTNGHVWKLCAHRDRQTDTHR